MKQILRLLGSISTVHYHFRWRPSDVRSEPEASVTRQSGSALCLKRKMYSSSLRGGFNALLPRFCRALSQPAVLGGAVPCPSIMFMWCTLDASAEAAGLAHVAIIPGQRVLSRTLMTRRLSLRLESRLEDSISGRTQDSRLSLTPVALATSAPLTARPTPATVRARSTSPLGVQTLSTLGGVES